MSITVGELKDILQTAIESMEDLDDNQKISLVSNTYFLGNANHFIGISGYDGGYCDLDDIKVEEDDADDEESDD